MAGSASSDVKTVQVHVGTVPIPIPNVASSSRELEIEEDEVLREMEEEEEMMDNPDQGVQPVSRRRRTSEEVRVDKQRITAQGLATYFSNNPGYIKGLVADVYKHMKVAELGKISEKGAWVTSKIGRLYVVVDPDIIARALNYERPPAASEWGKLEPGVLNSSILTKSVSQSRGTMEAEGVLGGSYLTTMPSKRAKQSVWSKLLFCQGVAIMNSHCKLKKEIWENARRQERMDHWLDYIVSRQDGSTNEPYAPPPIEDVKDSDDFVGEEPESVDDK
ncbi:hypothetical protein RHSIM_Rhsim01G0160400 [Rhododendron simsii]|uniref:Uncharacterized protein n=1 Tax=Rhododendron simsii TaxID=118357 RepID=A0A834LZ00_RHOSS|nr:hypothetical protein RHSIM_Rhsim01G0160400 [Rhododendron simsii]